MQRKDLSGRILDWVLRRFGEEEIALAVPARMLELQACFVPDDSPWRGWRVERDGPRVVIRRSFPWWESVWYGEELNLRGSKTRLLRSMAFGPFGFEYRLDGELAETPKGPMLYGRIMVHGSIRVGLMFFLISPPALSLLVLPGVALEVLSDMAKAWPDVVEMLWMLVRAGGGLGLIITLLMAFSGMLLGVIHLMGRAGAHSRERLMAFVTKLIHEAAAISPRSLG